MVITFDLQGRDRKELVKAIAEITGARPVYKFMPTCAFEIDFFTVTKEGTLEFPDRSDTELVEMVLDELAEKGFTMESAVNESGHSEMFESEESSETEEAAETPTPPDTAAVTEVEEVSEEAETTSDTATPSDTAEITETEEVSEEAEHCPTQARLPKPRKYPKKRKQRQTWRHRPTQRKLLKALTGSVFQCGETSSMKHCSQSSTALSKARATFSKWRSRPTTFPTRSPTTE